MARKNYKGSKQEPKMDMNKGEMKEQPMSLISAIAQPDGSQIYAVNSQLVDVGGTAQATEIYVKPLIVGNLLFDSATTPNSLLTAQMQDLIDAFATARGYVTGVTTAKVAQYLKASEEYFSLIVWLHRAQNGTKFTTDTGYNLGTTLGSRYRNNVLTVQSTIANFIGDNGGTVLSLENDGSASISNTEWSRDWLSHLVNVKLPRAAVTNALATFGVIYSYNKEGSYLINNIPAILTSGSFIGTIKDNLVTVMTNLRAADPDLIDILHFLGFTNEMVSAVDFTRDQRGLTLPIIHDEVFNSAVFNAYALAPGCGGDSDLKYLFFDRTGVSSPLAYVDSADLDATILFNHLILRNRIAEHYQVEVFRSSSKPNSSGVFDFPFFITTDNITLTSLTNVQLGRARSCLVSYLSSVPVQLPFTDFVTITEIAPGDFALNGVNTPSEEVSESYGSFKLPESEWDYYTLAKKADMVMGDIQWRTAIQQLVAKIRPQAITRSS